MFMLSLGVGLPLLLVSGVMLWLLWRRQTNQYQPVAEGIFRNAQASPWANNHEMPTTPDVSQYASSTTSASGVSGALLIPHSSQPMPSPQLAYTPSDLRPITTAFSRQMLSMSSSDEANSGANGDLVPLPMDTLSLPLQSSRARAAKRNGQMPTTPALLPALMDTPIPPILASPALSVTADPPSIKDDPVLEAVMRQAQMGLFALPGR